jgi:putative DNA-invertase from lambdoid prophage Rac
MSRLFAYARVSTAEQTADNQRQALKAAGYDPGLRYFEEQISGRVPALERPVFLRMVNKMEPGDRLVVLKLDRLGRNAADILQTVEFLQAEGISVTLLDGGAGDLDSAAGRLFLTLLAAFAQFESDRISERTREGMARSGKKAGRPVGQSPAMAQKLKPLAFLLRCDNVSTTEQSNRGTPPCHHHSRSTAKFCWTPITAWPSACNSSSCPSTTAPR